MISTLENDSLTEIDKSQRDSMDGFVSNAFGERYLSTINHKVFEGNDASTVFRSYFGESIFEEDRFYIIVGTDSGLLYQYVLTQGVPKGSRYLFVELPQVLEVLGDINEPKDGLSITTEEYWLERATEMEMEKYALLGRLILFRSLGVVHGHCGDYSPLWQKFKGEFDAFVWNQNAALGSRLFTICQIENLTENQVPAICLRETFRGKTAVVLAGGPSLSELLPWVRKHRQNLLVIAASRISGSLLEADIQPDIVISIDPNHINLKVSREMLKFQDSALLVNMFHLSPRLLSSWGGPNVYMGPRYPWNTPLQPENLPPSGGATVTNVAYTLAVETGVTQIILGGADFCHSQEGYTHASGSVEHAMGSMPQFSDQRVETNDGMMADTKNALLQSAKTIDFQAKNALAQGCQTINPASGAMRLPHVKYLPPESIQLEPLEKPARQVLTDCMPLIDDCTRRQHYEEVLSELNRTLTELKAVKELSSKALSYNRKVLTKAKGGSNNKSKKIDPKMGEKVDRIDEQLNAKYADTTKFVKNYGTLRFVPILGLDVKQIEDLVENSQIHFQSMLVTSKELIDILDQARIRTMSRLEEDKSQPNILRLLKQWRQDQQPGRAIQWARQHTSTLSELPDAQQQALHEFMDTFDDAIEELSQHHITSIEQGLELGGTPSKARECFLCGDQEGLMRLLVGLQTHRDQKQAIHFTPLVQGYLAELRDEPIAAIAAYKSISEGPILVDAHMRLFELHSKNQDWPSALEVLKTLSDISPKYCPMYADMLQSNGDIDAAVEIYTDYLLANPDDLNTMMKLGKLFQQCESAEGVAWTMSYILNKDPDNQTAKAMLMSLEQSQVSS